MRYLLIGGTGSLGQALIKQISKDNEITIVSRDELKQQQLKAKYPYIKFHICDIADPAIEEFIEGKEVVINLAALKHVDVCENNLKQNIKTNILGNMNIADLCEKHWITHVIFSSTDKAVLPINAYGHAKALSEKYYLSKNAWSDSHFTVYRWGNVLGSRGSVLHKFVETIANEGKVYITHKDMTRFWVHIDDVAKFILDTYKSAARDKAMIPEMKSSSIVALAKTVALYLDKDFEVIETGIRDGEKIHECLWSQHDSCQDDSCLRSNTSEKYDQAELFNLVDRCLS